MDVSLRANCNGIPTGLTFSALVDTQTGFILNPIQRAYDRGLNFRLVPRLNGQGHRVEVRGSLHKFYNHGQHNADQFTANDLLLTLDRLVTTYGINPVTSKINTMEFGVNVVLPFPVSQVLQNLVSYKNKPFTRDRRSTTPYHECRLQQYTVKMYDKGKQRGLDDHLLRVEIKVAKMVYFNKTGVYLNTLADLLNVANYAPLGRLLVDTFGKILFDEPTINPNDLTPREQDIYQKGRNPRYWQVPDDLPRAERSRLYKQRQRVEQQYRDLFDRHQQGNPWQGQTTALIGQTWERLTTVTDDLLTRMDNHRAMWKNLSNTDCGPIPTDPETTTHPIQKCPLLTDFSSGEQPGEMSTFNPLYSGLKPDTVGAPSTPEPADQPRPVVCSATGVIIDQPRPTQRFVSAAMLRNNDDLLLMLESQHRQYAKGSKEDPYTQAAHNARNRESNERNNLRKRLNRVIQQSTLFDVSETVRLTADQRAALDYWQGTPYEVRL